MLVKRQVFSDILLLNTDIEERLSMSKGKGAIVKVSGLARRNEVERASRNSRNTRNLLRGQRSLPRRTRDVIDVGGGWTYEV